MWLIYTSHLWFGDHVLALIFPFSSGLNSTLRIGTSIWIIPPSVFLKGNLKLAPNKMPSLLISFIQNSNPPSSLFRKWLILFNMFIGKGSKLIVNAREQSSTYRPYFISFLFESPKMNRSSSWINTFIRIWETTAPWGIRWSPITMHIIFIAIIPYCIS